jgi:hypothetical protein
MAVRNPRRRMGALFLPVVALLIPWPVAGCGGDSQPAPVDVAQAKKAQAYMANYREQIIADNKAKAKAKAAAKSSP